MGVTVLVLISLAVVSHGRRTQFSPSATRPHAPAAFVSGVGLPAHQHTAPRNSPALMGVDMKVVKQMREATGAGLAACKKALAAADGDYDSALKIMREQGILKAGKRAGKATTQGVIHSYIHDNRIGIMMEVNCETDFVAKTDIFKDMVGNLTLQVVAKPYLEFVSMDKIPADYIEKERELALTAEDLQGKPDDVKNKIVDGRVKKLLLKRSLFDSTCLWDESSTIEEYVKNTMFILGENMRVARFTRFTLGETGQAEPTGAAAETEEPAEPAAEKPQMEISLEEAGEFGTTDYSMTFKSDGNVISPWHDAPLELEGGLYNMLTEIPKMTLKKMEVDTKAPGNPIKQDEKKGKARLYHGPIFWNYGCLPQTWEDPNVKGDDDVGGAFGDNDPVDVVEIGAASLAMGSFTPVKVLGCLSMIDDGELDWKVIAINAADEHAAEINDVGDIEKYYPGTVSGIREWFRWYKTPDDKPVNSFGHSEKALGAAEAKKVIEETHGHYQSLLGGWTDAGKLWIPGKSGTAPASPAEIKAPEPTPAPAPAPAPAAEEGPQPYELLDIRVGKIVEAWEHPDSEKLWVEKIDVGEEEPRQIASGLRAYYSTSEDLVGRKVLVVCNLKTAKLGGVPSAGMVLCASDEDKGTVAFVEPPEAAELGQRVLMEGKEAVTPASPNQVGKKKWMWKAAEDLKAVGTVATYKGTPLVVAGSPCTSPTVSEGTIS